MFKLYKVFFEMAASVLVGRHVEDHPLRDVSVSGRRCYVIKMLLVYCANITVTKRLRSTFNLKTQSEAEITTIINLLHILNFNSAIKHHISVVKHKNVNDALKIQLKAESVLSCTCGCPLTAERLLH